MPFDLSLDVQASLNPRFVPVLNEPVFTPHLAELPIPLWLLGEQDSMGDLLRCL